MAEMIAVRAAGRAHMPPTAASVDDILLKTEGESRVQAALRRMPISVRHLVTFLLGKESDQFATPKSGGVRI